MAILKFITDFNLTLNFIALVTSILVIILNLLKDKETRFKEKKETLLNLSHILYKLNFVFPGIKEKTLTFIDLMEKHLLLKISTVILICFVPILNVIVICVNINELNK